MEILYDFCSITPGAVGSGGVAVADGRYASLEEDFRIIKMDVFCAAELQTGGEPAIIGIASKDLSSSEISECLNSAPQNRSDRVELEESGRPVWPLTLLMVSANGDGTVVDKFEKTLRWTFSDANGWQWFIFNPSAGAMTTGSEFDIFTKIYGVWVS